MYLFQWCTDNCLCLDIGPRRLGQLNGEDDTLLFTMSASLPALTITDDRWCVSIDDEYPNGRIVRGSVFRIAAEEFADDLPKQGHRIAVSRLTGSTSHCRWEGILQQGKIDWSSVVRFEDLVEEDGKYFVPLKLGIFKEYFNKDSFSIVISSGLYLEAKSWDSNVYTPHTVVIDTSDVKFKEDVLLVQLPDPIACKAYAVTITNRHWVPGVRERWYVLPRESNATEESTKTNALNTPSAEPPELSIFYNELGPLVNIYWDKSSAPKTWKLVCHTLRGEVETCDRVYSRGLEGVELKNKIRIKNLLPKIGEETCFRELPDSGDLMVTVELMINEYEAGEEAFLQFKLGNLNESDVVQKFSLTKIIPQEASIFLDAKRGSKEILIGGLMFCPWSTDQNFIINAVISREDIDFHLDSTLNIPMQAIPRPTNCSVVEDSGNLTLEWAFAGIVPGCKPEFMVSYAVNNISIFKHIDSDLSFKMYDVEKKRYVLDLSPVLKEESSDVKFGVSVKGTNYSCQANLTMDSL